MPAQRYVVYYPDMDGVSPFQCRDFFRGLFWSYGEAIERCEDILEYLFRRLARLAVPYGLTWEEIDRSVFSRVDDIPAIMLEDGSKSPGTYNARGGFEYRLSQFALRHRLPSFHLGQHVAVSGLCYRPESVHNQVGCLRGGRVVRSSVLAGHPRYERCAEWVGVRFDSGEVVDFPATSLISCPVRPETEPDRDRRLLMLRMSDEVLKGEPGDKLPIRPLQPHPDWPRLPVSGIAQFFEEMPGLEAEDRAVWDPMARVARWMESRADLTDLHAWIAHARIFLTTASNLSEATGHRYISVQWASARNCFRPCSGPCAPEWLPDDFSKTCSELELPGILEPMIERMRQAE